MSGTIRMIHHSGVMQQPSVNQTNSCSWIMRSEIIELRHWWCRLEHRMWSTTTVWFACRVRRGHCRDCRAASCRKCWAFSCSSEPTTAVNIIKHWQRLEDMAAKKSQMLQILKQSQRAWRTTLPKTGGKRERFDAQISEWNLAARVDAERDLLWGSHHPHSACGKMTIWQFKVGCNFNLHEYWRLKAYPIQR